MTETRKTLWILGGSAALACGIGLLLSAALGPTDAGMVCAHHGRETCQVQRARLLGLAGYESWPVPLAAIARARGVCGSGQVGGRASPSCWMELLPRAPGVPPAFVASYPLAQEAEAAADRTNRFLADPEAPDLRIRPAVGSALLVSGGPALAALALGLLLLRLRRAPRAAGGSPPRLGAGAP